MTINFQEILSQADQAMDSVYPDGWYPGKIEKSEIKETKSGTGAYIGIQIKSDKIGMQFCNINIKNDNPIAVQIGMSVLKTLKIATGIVQAQNPSVFSGKQIEFLLKTGKKGDQQIVAFRAPEALRAPTIKPEQTNTAEDIF